MQQVVPRNPRPIMICGIASWGRMHAAQKEQAGPEAPVQQDPHLVADGVASSVANTTSTQYSLCIPQPVSTAGCICVKGRIHVVATELLAPLVVRQSVAERIHQPLLPPVAAFHHGLVLNECREHGKENSVDTPLGHLCIPVVRWRNCLVRSTTCNGDIRH